MRCPICQLDDNHVERTVQHGNDIARVRRCICGHRFTTFETSESEIKRLRKLERAIKEASEDLLHS